MEERKTLFKKSDAYQWKTPKGFPFISFTPYEKYSEWLKDVFLFNREGGILEARFHTGGDSMLWDLYIHKCIHQFFTWAGQDHNNEVLICKTESILSYRFIMGMKMFRCVWTVLRNIQISRKTEYY